MLYDSQDKFSAAQSIVDTGISTNQRDNGPVADNVTRNLGVGQPPLWLVVLTDTAVTRAAGACTVTFSLESDSTNNLATSPTVHFSSGAIAKASLTAGAVAVCTPLPSGNYEQYLGVRYTFSAAADAGAFTAFLTTTPQQFQQYADRVSIL